MIDVTAFECELAHAKCKEGLFESASSEAIKIDDADGLAVNLGFGESALSKVDYCRCSMNSVQLIELTDLEDSLISCRKMRVKLTEQAQTAADKEKRKLTKGDHNSIRKEAWQSVINEFKCKWNGSIAVVERLLRRYNVVDDPEYKLLIVCKNKTDCSLLDELSTQLFGMMGKVRVCNTGKVERYLIS